MSSSDRLVGSRSRESIELFHETRLVRITLGGFAIWIDPFGMLDPQIVVNPLLELALGMDLVRHGNLPWRKVQVWRGTVPTEGLAELPTSVRAVSAPHRRVKLLQKGDRTCLPSGRRWANSITLWRWRCSKTASSPLCVRVRFDFVIT